LRAGYIYKEMAGAYVFLPLGLKVFNNVMQLIREEMNAIGGQELLMTSLQDKAVWEKTDRWNDDVVDNWFKTKLKTGVEVGLGFTHEEPLTNLMREYISSFRDLPFSAYQFQTKFRNETRAKSGIMRGREFVMKDLYSFSRSQKEHDEFYEKAKQAYVRVFERAGLGEVTYVTFASGGTFSKYSHEFQTITDAGEDVIYIDKEKNIAINKEVYNDEVLKDLGVDKSKVIEAKAVEVGNIFGLGTKFSDAFDLNYLDEKGEKQRVVMGSYGIGPARLMGTVVEVLSDEKGIVWPISIAPFRYHLVSLAPEDEEVKKLGEEIYYALTEKGIEVLYDDRVGPSAGEKFNDSDLLGVPTRIVVSKKVIEKGMLEVKDRKSGEVTSMTKSELLGQA
jgi:prolyl-tRNA synthetase